MSKAETHSRPRGSGSIFQKPGNTVWTIQYYKLDPATGKRKRFREATGLTSRSEALKILTERLSQVNKQEPFEHRRLRGGTTVADLYDGLKTDIEINKGQDSASLEELEWRWAHLKPAFAHVLAANLTTDHIKKYKSDRKKEAAANGTINRELATMRHMFNLGRRATPPKVRAMPFFQMLPESKPRQGFVEQKQFDSLVDKARELWPEELWLRCWLELAYFYGWRKGELLSLLVEQVNFFTRTIRLSDSKNGDGREVTFSAGSRVEALLRAAVDGKKPKDYVLTRNGQPADQPVGQFPGTWATLCVSVGLGEWVCKKCGEALATKIHKGECGGRRKYRGLIPHDFRRSAAKAARRAGVAESVVMAMGGWRTASMFRRYAIVSSRDQQQAVDLIEAARERERAEAERPPKSAPIEAERENKAGNATATVQ